MKDHCYYCRTPLYRMYLERGVYSHVDHEERYSNSDGMRICEKCTNRIARRGTAFNCHSCSTPVFTLRNDHFKEDVIRRKHLQGIAPQPDPYDRAYIKCRHCSNEITAWE